MQDLEQFLLFLALICAGSHVHGSVIINGKLAPEGSLRFMASVQDINGHVCGGFLIREDFVVTAAHCDRDLTHVVLGGHNLKNGNTKTIQITSKCKHMLYKDVGFGYDIMLLELANKAPIGKNMQKIPLAEMSMKVKDNEVCSVAGWGKTESNDSSLDNLRVVNVSIISQEVCQENWNVLPVDVICAGGFKTTKGFCQGDSGGPLVCNGKAVGIVSFNKNYNCKYPDVPNIYTDIRKHVEWINMTIMKNCPN